MTKKGLFTIALSSVLALSAVCFAACNGKEPEKKPDDDPNNNQTTTDTWRDQSIWLNANPALPTAAATLPASSNKRTTNVSVHDPSIFRDPEDGQFYAFGTHFAVASSYDLIEWNQEAGDNEYQVLYGSEKVTINGVNWPKALEETIRLVKPVSTGDAITTTWAPDVEYLNGKYYMYYSVTQAFGSSNSAIGRLEADSVMGPYSNNEILLQSVSADAPNFVSEASGGKPNCIDSELFFDKEGKLWMVYGSHFGGIYIKELYNTGDKIGLPKEEGAGKLLWSGGNKVVEGPFVYYNATTKYYYLMTTYGALMTDYNMHVARSQNPDGPYEDVSGKDMATLTKSEAGNTYGNKVAGNFRFDRDGHGQNQGYAAMGHNSVIKDEDGNYFVIFHTRRQSKTSGNVEKGHNLVVSRILFNKEGWPVVSPTFYVGEKAGLVTAEKAAGDYEIVLHSTTTTVTSVASEAYMLAADGKVTKGGTEVGTWEMSDSYYVSLTINSVTYSGVVSVGWDNYATETYQKGVYTISAVSNTGASLWALSK